LKNDSIELFSLIDQVIQGAVGQVGIDLAAALQATLRSIGKSDAPTAGPRISFRGVLSGIVTFQLKLGTPAADASRLDVLSVKDPALLAGWITKTVSDHARLLGEASMDEAKDQRFAKALSLMLVELYAVAETERYNAKVEAAEPGQPKGCHVVAQVASQEQAMLHQLGLGVMGAHKHLPTPCGLISAVSGLARVPAKRRLAAAAELIRWLNTFRESADPHDDLDHLADLAMIIYG
jgi:hypothetical protein